MNASDDDEEEEEVPKVEGVLKNSEVKEEEEEEFSMSMDQSGIMEESRESEI